MCDPKFSGKRVKIKYVVLDVDGTMTDGKIYMGSNGELLKRFDVKDGCGIRDLLPACGIVPVVITARTSEIVSRRCLELGIKYCFQGCRDKKEQLIKLAGEFGIETVDGRYEEIAYMGDDLIDIPGMKICGISACPADAVREVREEADFVASHKGGDGAVRDFCDWLARKRN